MRALPAPLLALCAMVVPSLALGPWHHFVTEPQMRSSIFNISINSNHNLLAPGYIFVTTYVSDFRVGSFGPQIYDMDGTLIWNGNESARIRAMDAHVCDYLGDKGTHICMNDAEPVEQAGHSAGAIRFFDNTYTQVGEDFGAAGDLRAPDIHELNTPAHDNGHTMLQDIYEVRSMDLTPYLGKKDGYVLDGCFQEIDLKTRGVNFQWCMLDHLPIWDTYLYLHIPNTPGKNDSMPIAGNGTINSPWDFAHLNAVGKNLEGDYIISARHLDAVFKIAGKNNNLGKPEGEILWQLGGKRNDFQMLDGLTFSRQHTVRFVSTGKTETTISLFNNAFDGWFYTSHYSDGQLILLNNETMEARLLHSYAPPEEERSRSFSQGSMQIMPNGNVFMGWGNRAYVSEHSADGTPIYWAFFSGSVESFRAWKFPWVGRPKTKPKIISYALNSFGKMYAYVSWNGATEVKSWAVYYSDSTRHGPWVYAGTLPKNGFETTIDFTALNDKIPVLFHPYVYAAALDKRGRVLAKSDTYETFVPIQKIKRGCNETMCSQNWYKYQIEESEAQSFPRSHGLAILVVAFLLCAAELLQWIVEEFGWSSLIGILGITPNYMVWSTGNGPSGKGFSYATGDSDSDSDDYNEKHSLYGRPVPKHFASGPSSPIVILNGKSGTGFAAKVSGVEV